jgi:UDP-N-acetylglucosamine--N-acetylmuramyl-(pentapeptide) pyrophosphoryl-undecaprenol N-acetylglucosamine transferase
MKIVFTGGGTGGHIFPIIAVTRALKKIGPFGMQYIYIGPKDNYSKDALEKEEISTHYILSGKIRRYFTIPDFFANIVDIFFKIPLGIIQSFYLIFTISPDLIFSKGGYGSVPTVIAGWILGVPVYLHESDVSPGLANRLLAKFSKEIFVSFPVKDIEYFPMNKMLKVGNPTREYLMNGSKEKAKEIFKLKGEKPLILILGGSQGSQRINDLIMEILPQLITNYEIIHQTGERDLKRVEKQINALISDSLKESYHIVPFLKEDEIRNAYAAADCVVSRAGSGIIFELAMLKKPSILIPLPEAAQNHQAKNAYTYAKYNACIVLEENNLTPNFFLKRINDLFEFNRLEDMKKGAESFAKPYAADIIAKYLLDFLTK